MIGAKAIATVLVGIGSMAVAFAVGALGNLAGSALAGVDTVWNISLSTAPQIVLGNLVGMAIGFTLGVVLRNSAAAIVATSSCPSSCQASSSCSPRCVTGSMTCSRESTGTTRRSGCSRVAPTLLANGPCSARPPPSGSRYRSSSGCCSCGAPR